LLVYCAVSIYLSISPFANTDALLRDEWDYDEDTDEDEADDAAYAQKVRASASPAVRKALEAFEGNIAFYANHPGMWSSLCLCSYCNHKYIPSVDIIA